MLLRRRGGKLLQCGVQVGDEVGLGRLQVVADVADAKVEAMIAQSVDHAFEDMSERQFAEAAIKSRELLEAVAAALPQAGEALDEAARERILSGIAEVETALGTGELRRLKAANAALDAATETLAALLVERAMDEAAARRMGRS